MAEIEEGTVIDGRYKVVSRLGSGGMADVFLAEDQQLGRKVALKLLHRRFAEDPGFVERFRREAQAAARLQHPNVVGVYDRGASDGTYYIAMEYLPGRSLKQMIREEAPIDPVRATDITIQILKAARFAHRHGVIHRDLKPHNVIIDEADQAKVTDFGIARAGASDMTETGSIMGTAQYLSPEQAQGHAVSAASDLYSVGVVLYELLTGRVPFDAEAAVTIALKHVSESPTPPSAINPNVPPELEQIALWALNKNRADRPTDADQFVTALEQARAAIVAGSGGQRTTSMVALAAVGGVAGVGGGPPAETPSSSVAAGAPPPPLLPPAIDGARAGTGEPAPPRRRRGVSPWVWVVLALLLLGGGGAAAYLLTRPVKEIVPNVVGEQVRDARTRVQNASLTPNLVYQPDAHASGTVIAQDPLAGAKADQGSTVTLTVSQGPGNANVPSVYGLSMQRAERAITSGGLKVGRVESESSGTVPAGEATRTDPASGSSISVGSSVVLFISSGKPQVTVPPVTDISQQAAEGRLSTNNLTFTTTTQASSTVTPGNVISQDPAAGTQVAQGTTVNLVIATKAPSTTTTVTTATVPGVVGDTSSAAQSQLKTHGFQVSVQTQDTTKQNQNGIVISQNPAGGATANKNSTVTIVVGKYKAPTHTTTTTTTTSSKSTKTTTTHTTTHSSST